MPASRRQRTTELTCGKAARGLQRSEQLAPHVLMLAQKGSVLLRLSGSAEGGIACVWFRGWAS